MTICSPEKCFGCGLCVAVCPVNCVSMRIDAVGELHPFTDMDKCLLCGLCARKCPANNDQDLRYPLEFYAAKNHDIYALKGSSSGGVAYILASLFPKRVFGTAWDNNHNAIVKRGDPEEFKGSKYVQSIISPSVFHEIAELSKESDILFIGTPCQIAAVKSYTGKNDRLFTVDLLCHGVCPPEYLSAELQPLLKLFPKTAKVSFREGNTYRFELKDSEDGTLFSCPAVKQPYFRAFLEGVSLRENCYNCPFARKERLADITLGDFIGREGQVSWVSVNTEKGQTLFKSTIARNLELHVEACEYEERLAYPYSLLKPFPKSKLRDAFLRVLKRKDYMHAIRRVKISWFIQDAPSDFHHWIHHMAHLLKVYLTKSPK